MSYQLTPEQRQAVRAFIDLIRSGGLDFDDVLRLSVNVEIELRGADGALKDSRRVHNQICTAGKNQVLLAASGKLPAAFAYLAIGTSATAPAAGDTALGAEVARGLSTVTNPSGGVLQFVYAFAAGVGTGAITEAGLLDAASTGNLLSHLTFSVINKAGTDTLTITYQLS